MQASSSVELFEHQCSAEVFPPQLSWVEAEIQKILPVSSEILQWAIVKADFEHKRLWIEGSYIQQH